jgi:hypothetical protein
MLCVDLMRQYTVKGKDNTSINFMCLTMIDPETSWFNKIELPIVTKMTVPNTGKGKKGNILTHLRQSFTCKGFFPHLIKTQEK